MEKIPNPVNCESPPPPPSPLSLPPPLHKERNLPVCRPIRNVQATINHPKVDVSLLRM